MQRAAPGTGKDAIPYVRQAVNSNNPELSQRARKLVIQLQKQAEEEMILAPSRIIMPIDTRLALPKCLDLLSKQTGIEFQVKDKLVQNRYLTLSSSHDTYWRILGELYHQAGLLDTECFPDFLSNLVSESTFTGGIIVPHPHSCLIARKTNANMTAYYGNIRLSVFNEGPTVEGA